MSFATGSEMSRAHELFHRLEREGSSFIRELYSTQKSEELFLDYKAIATKPGQSINPSDLANLRKAISGFGNSEGGVILWGLRTTKTEGIEKIEEPNGYEDAQRFITLIEGAVSGCVIPPVPGVRSIVILDSDDKTKGFVATLIPPSPSAPHQTTDDQRAYYMRAGSSFQRVPHGVLAGMFGRRPTPSLSIRRTVTRCVAAEMDTPPAIYIELEIEILNQSGVIARDIYVSWQAVGLGGPHGSLEIMGMHERGWREYNEAGLLGTSLLADEDYRLAPFSSRKVVTLNFLIPHVPSSDLEVNIYVGCDGAPPKIYRQYVAQQDLKWAIEDLIDNEIRDPLSSSGKRLARSVLGLIETA